MKPIRRVLFATDLSPASRRAFMAAMAIVASSKAKLSIIYVTTPILPTVPERYLDVATLNKLEHQARLWSAHQLATLATRARKHGITVAAQIRQGSVTDEILSAAKAQRADLIVVGTHGRRGLTRFFLGSVAQRLVTVSPYPVLTVRSH